MRLLVFLSLMFISQLGFTQAVLVKDINQNPASSSISIPIELNGKVYFVSNFKLWESDGTENGTHLVSLTSELAVVGGVVGLNGKLLFQAATEEFGRELMVTDGTTYVELLKDITLGPGNTAFDGISFRVCSNKLFFITYPESNSVGSLWVTDGSGNGTFMLKTFKTLSILESGCLNGKILFYADDSLNNGLWVSDGTEVGTFRLSNVCCGFQGFIQLEDKMYFIRSGQLWRTNGEEFGTSQVTFPGTYNFSLQPGNQVKGFIANHCGKLFFAAKDDIDGTELWSYDGSNLSKVMDIWAGPQSSSPRKFVSVGSKLYFIADDVNARASLFTYDCSTLQTEFIKDINPEGTSLISPIELVEKFGNMVVFVETNANSGAELWISDGTVENTKMVADINQGSTSAISLTTMYEFNGRLLFLADNGVNGRELHSTDGSEAGTFLLKDLLPGTASSDITRLYSPLGKLHFMANDGAGFDLWTSDGPDFTTKMIKDFGAEGVSNLGRNMDTFGDRFVFTPQSFFGYELWISDGTSAGTKEIIDLKPGLSSGISPGALVVAGESIFFRGDAGTSGFELWKSDGTAEGTVLLKDINAGQPSSFPTNFYWSNNKVIFFAVDATGLGVWSSEGESTNTLKLMSFINGSLAGTVKVGNSIYFAINDSAEGFTLFRTDGTSGGTNKVKVIAPPGIGALGPQYMVSTNEHCYFSFDDGVHGTELWVSDGTDLGTRIVKDIRDGSSGSIGISDNSADVILDKIYFTANDGVHGKELWVTDGTEEGTKMFFDLQEGPESSNPYFIRSYRGNLFFGADHEGVPKTWYWNSKLDEPKVLGGKNPSNFLLVDNTLYFLADDESTGRELWKVAFDEDKLVNTGTVTSIQLEKMEDSYVFPNPSSGVIHLKLKPLESAIKVKNSLGQQIQVEMSHGNGMITIDVSSLSPGLYILETRQGDKLTSYKFLKR